MDEVLAHRIAHALVQKGINLLAVDFDDTLIDTHTQGRWNCDAAMLKHRVRPLFLVFIPVVLEYGIHVAIVTFSSQVSMIAELMRIVFPDHFSRIYIRGNDDSWQYQGLGSVLGKQRHMASVAEEISLAHDINITRNSTILIDDCSDNINAALDSEVRAIYCNPKYPETVIETLIRLCKLRVE